MSEENGATKYAVFTRAGERISVAFDRAEDAQAAITEARPEILAALDQAGAHVRPIPPGGEG